MDYPQLPTAPAPRYVWDEASQTLIILLDGRRPPRSAWPFPQGPRA